MAQRRKVGPLEKLLGRSPLAAVQKAIAGKKTKASRKRK